MAKKKEPVKDISERLRQDHPQHVHLPGCDHTEAQDEADARRKAWEDAHRD